VRSALAESTVEVTWRSDLWEVKAVDSTCALWSSESRRRCIVSASAYLPIQRRPKGAASVGKAAVSPPPHGTEITGRRARAQRKQPHTHEGTHALVRMPNRA
jgi:hypothetical protein